MELGAIHGAHWEPSPLIARLAGENSSFAARDNRIRALQRTVGVAYLRYPAFTFYWCPLHVRMTPPPRICAMISARNAEVWMFQRILGVVCVCLRLLAEQCLRSGRQPAIGRVCGGCWISI